MASVQDLPDELLAAVFARIGVQERHEVLPLVCRRWAAAAVNSPQLLRNIEICIYGRNPMPRLRSLGEWLALRAAPHVRQLTLELLGDLASQEQNEANTILAAALAACGTGGQLGTLDVYTQWPLAVSSWLSPLGGGLRSLTIGSEECECRVAGSLAALANLEELDLGFCSSGIVWEAGARLPASLTRLQLSNGDALPDQLRALTNLRQLTLIRSDIPPDGCAALTALSSLHRLELEDATIPSCLPELTWLRALRVEYEGIPEEEELPTLLQAVPRLQGLTHLDLRIPELPGLPAALTGLTALHSLRLLYCEDGLLPGRWLRSLQQLMLPAKGLERSLPALNEARQLQAVGVAGLGSAEASALPIFGWAARHPSLRRLLVGRVKLDWTGWQALLAAVQQNPGLAIEPSHPSDLFD